MAAARIAVANDDYLAILLDDHRVSQIGARRSEPGELDASGTEARVQQPGRGVAGEREVVGVVRIAAAGDDDLLVFLDHNGRGAVAAGSPEICQAHAGVAKARVENTEFV